MRREYCKSKCTEHTLWPGTQGQLGRSLVTTALSGQDGCSVRCPWVGSSHAAHRQPLQTPHHASSRHCQSTTNMLWVQSSTESPHARSSQGDQSCCVPPNCQLGQGMSILINDQQPNNYRNFQVAYGKLSGQLFVWRLCYRGRNLRKNLFFLLERIVLCWLTLLVRSVAVARILCAHQHVPHHCPLPSLSLPTPGRIRAEPVDN